MTQSNDTKTCQLCGNANLSEFEIPNRIRLLKCTPCELFQYGKAADEQAYAAHYHDGYEKNRDQKIQTAVARLSRIAPFLKSQKPKLLDIGCSVGCTVEAANMRGWEGVGVDVSADAVDYCQKQGLNCQTVGSLELPFEDHTFDAVVSWHVIEHVEDVRETLSQWRRVLKPGGIMVMETPDASSPKVRRKGVNYEKFWAPEHTYTFTPYNLTKFLEQSGFEIVRQPILGSLGSVGVKNAAYAVAHQSYLGMRKYIGIHKAFQLFARRIETGETGQMDRKAA